MQAAGLRTDPRAGGAEENTEGEADHRRRWGARAVARWRSWRGHPARPVVGAAALALVLPLVVAMFDLRRPQWFPVTDTAVVELRLRDIAEGRFPLVGQYGRFEAYDRFGNHPGPLMYWALFPVYWVLGASAWSMQVATAFLNLVAMVAVVAVGYRRGGRGLALGLVVGLALLARSYGFDKLTVPWNPYMAALWWVLLVVVVWSLLDDDLALVPVAVVAGSMCLQSHFGYLGIVAVVFGVGLLGVIQAARRPSPDSSASSSGRPQWRRPVRWLALGAVVGVALWIPPLVEQMTHSPGNLSVLWHDMLHPDPGATGRSPGMGGVTRIWLAHRNPLVLLSHTVDSITVAPESPILPGVVMLVAWLGAVVASWRHRLATVNRLHLVLAAVLAAELISMRRAGLVLDYLVLWAWGTTMLLVVAVGMTITGVLAERRIDLLGRLRIPPRAIGATTAAVLVAVAVASGYDAARVRDEVEGEQAAVVSHLAGATVERLASGRVPGVSADDRFMLRWGDDALWGGLAGVGLFLELERQGFDVGTDAYFAESLVGSHRVWAPADADTVLHLVIGPQLIERWQGRAGVVTVATYDPRTPAEVEEYERLDREIRVELVEAGREDLVEALDSGLYRIGFSDLPDGLQAKLARLGALGMPTAVFAAPVDVGPLM